MQIVQCNILERCLAVFGCEAQYALSNTRLQMLFRFSLHSERGVRVLKHDLVNYGSNLVLIPLKFKSIGETSSIIMAERVFSRSRYVLVMNLADFRKQTA